MAFLKKVDHITYACARGTIEKWAWFHIEIEGGVLINRIDDVRAEDPDSSMKIWCIDYGEFGIALDRRHRPAQAVAGHAVRRAPRRSLLPARRLRLPRSRCIPLAPRSQRLPPARPDSRAQRRLRRVEADVREGVRGRRSEDERLPRVRAAAAARRRGRARSRSRKARDAASTSRSRTPWRPATKSRSSISRGCRATGAFRSRWRAARARDGAPAAKSRTSRA